MGSKGRVTTAMLVLVIRRAGVRSDGAAWAKQQQAMCLCFGVAGKRNAIEAGNGRFMAVFTREEAATFFQ